MKIKIIYLSLVILVLSSCNKEREQWVSLFNGEDLEGWQKLNGEAEYKVENEEIVGISKAGTPNTFLVTERLYSDFIFEFEVNVDSSINSGVQFRSNSVPEYRDGRVHGYQCEIDPSERAWSGGIYDEGRRGWLYPLSENEEGRAAFQNNEWNRYRIEAIGDTLRIWVNDVNTSNLVDSLTKTGFIGLQVHSIRNEEYQGKEIRWRKLRILTKDPDRFKRSDVTAPLLVNAEGQYPIN